MGLQRHNIDPMEIDKFKPLASRWWDPNGELKALHDINPLRVRYIAERTDLTGKRVLDVGCGGGILSEALAARGAEVTGIDMGEAALWAARNHMQRSGLAIDYRRSTAEALSASAAAGFDVVVCFELLEHVPAPASVFDACARLAKPGGDLFFATLNRNLKSYLFAVIGAEYILGLVPRGTHAHRRFIKPSEMAAWGQTGGLRLEDLTGLHFNPLSKKYTLGGNLHVNYLAHFHKTG